MLMDTETSLLEHRITPLLAPKSIALVGASEREGSVGRMMVEVLQAGGFGGAVHAINPKYETVLGLPCVAGLGDLSQAQCLRSCQMNIRRGRGISMIRPMD